MELKEFVKKVILDLDGAVTEANQCTGREIRFKDIKEQRNVLEFDVAVTAESVSSNEGAGGIKVLGIAELGGKINEETRNSIVSRVRFGVDISNLTKQEKQQRDSEVRNQHLRINQAI